MSCFIWTSLGLGSLIDNKLVYKCVDEISALIFAYSQLYLTRLIELWKFRIPLEATVITLVMRDINRINLCEEHYPFLLHPPNSFPSGENSVISHPRWFSQQFLKLFFSFRRPVFICCNLLFMSTKTLRGSP